MPQQSKSTARSLDELAYLAPSPQVQPIHSLSDWLRSPRHPEAPPVPRDFHAGCIITTPVTVKPRSAGPAAGRLAR
jgi:hypothetical protein